MNSDKLRGRTKQFQEVGHWISWVFFSTEVTLRLRGPMMGYYYRLWLWLMYEDILTVDNIYWLSHILSKVHPLSPPVDITHSCTKNTHRNLIEILVSWSAAARKPVYIYTFNTESEKNLLRWVAVSRRVAEFQHDASLRVPSQAGTVWNLILMFQIWIGMKNKTEYGQKKKKISRCYCLVQMDPLSSFMQHSTLVL